MTAVLYSFCQGLQLGMYTITISSILDNTISSEHTKVLVERDIRLYFEGMRANYLNLLLISPLYYIFVYLFLLDNLKEGFYLLDYISLLLIHNVGYYAIHKMMHKIPQLKGFHNFHHLFIDVIPSNGNAVSLMEFNLAYISPFIGGIYLISPNNDTLKSAIMTISFLNTFIHCPNFADLELPEIIVSPSKHINHHKKCTMETYAAPLLNIDYIVNEIQKICDSFVQDYNFVDMVEKLELQLKTQKKEDSDINILNSGDSIREDIEREIRKLQSETFKDYTENIEERNDDDDDVHVEETEDEKEKETEDEKVEETEDKKDDETEDEKVDDDEMVDKEEEVIENKGEQAKKED